MATERAAWVIFVKTTGPSAPIVSYHTGTRVAYEATRTRLPAELDAMLVSPADRPMALTLTFGFVDLTNDPPTIEYDADKLEADPNAAELLQRIIGGGSRTQRTTPLSDENAGWRNLPIVPRRKVTRQIVI